MKKFLTIALAFLSVTLLAACGNGNGNDLDDELDFEDVEEGVKRVTVWFHVSEERGEGRAYRRRIDAFNDYYDGEYFATANYIPRGGGASGYEEKVIAAHTTDNLPDVITLDGPNTSAYSIANIIQPIDDYLTSEDRSDFLSSVIEQGTYDGRIYSLAQMESTVGMYYNIDLFNECGIEPATMDDPWTWEVLRDKAERLDGCLPDGVHPLDLGFRDQTEWLTYALTPFLWTNGGRLVSPNGLNADGYFNSMENVEALEFLQDLYEDDLIFDQHATRPFHNGLIAMSLGGPWVSQELETEYPNMNWGVMPYPKQDEDAPLYSPTGSWALGVTNNAEHPEAAAEFVRWMTNTESTIMIHEETGMLPARHSAFDQLDHYNDENSPHYVLRRQLSETGRSRPATPSYPTISGSFRYVIEALTAGMDMRDVLDSRIAEIERDLSRFRD